MKYMLDTNICIYILNNKPVEYLDRLKKIEKNHSIFISSIVVSELQYGIARSQRKEQNQNNVNALLSRLEVLDYSASCAKYYGEIRASLQKKGVIIGGNDLFIASHAVYEDAVLVTNNTKEFRRINNLKLEDWSL